MSKVVLLVIAVGTTVVLSAVFLLDFCGLHVIHVTDGFMQCTDIDPDDFGNLHNVDWVRNDCV